MTRTAEPPVLEHYVAEDPRPDAVGTWLARVTLNEAMTVPDIIDTLNVYAEDIQDPNALLTGYILGDDDEHMRKTIVFGRDPYPNDTYRTLSGREYSRLITPFAKAHGELPRNILLDDDRFQTIVGRRPGYHFGTLFSMRGAALHAPGAHSVSLLPCHFFSTRYKDKRMRWDEPAVVVSGLLRDVHIVDSVAHGMKQRRFPLYTRWQTYAYNHK